MSRKMQEFGHRKSDYLRPNQVWQCGRADACKHGPTANGVCSQSKQPCVPFRTVRSRKKLITLWVVCVSVACVALLLSGPGLLPRLSPGPLSAGHAEVAGCQDCHAAAKQSVPMWIKSALRFSTHNDDQQCLTCHKLGDNAFLAHSTSESNFGASVSVSGDASPVRTTINWKIEAASKFRKWQQAGASNAGTDGNGEEISCSVCHREHRGELNNSAEFNPQKCHTCHQKKFDAIQDGHPEFTSFPHAKPTHIQFDHASHLGKHFLENDFFDKAPDGCKQCHATDQTGEWMLSSSFETGCSGCHLDDVLGNNRATAKGVAVLAIPELDVQSLTAFGLNVGEWPSWADGELTPFMRVLISAPNRAEKLTLYNLSDASPEQLNAAAQLAWEIKTLFYDIQMGGTQIIRQRLATAFGDSIDRSTLNRLIAAFPRDTLINNQQEWFPDLMNEMKRYKSGDINHNLVTGKTTSEANQNTLSKPLSNANVDSVVGDEIAVFDDDILTDDDEILSDDDDEILSDDDDEILSDDDDEQTLESDDEQTPDGLIKKEATLDQLIAHDNEAWAVTGGWYRDGSRIRYRPADHADLFFKTWLDVSATQYGAVDKSLFDSLSAEKSVGNCVKCHGIESDQDQGDNTTYKIHWRSFKPSDVKVDFNRFSHVSHFSLMTDDGCASCHLISSANEVADNSPSVSKAGGSGFENMERNTCTQCHQPGRAPDNCLTCHNYHAESEMREIEQIKDDFRGPAQKEVK